jgi:hypothetical protein
VSSMVIRLVDCHPEQRSRSRERLPTKDLCRSFVWINTDERNTSRNCHSNLEIVIPSKARNLLFAARTRNPDPPKAADA